MENPSHVVTLLIGQLGSYISRNRKYSIAGVDYVRKQGCWSTEVLYYKEFKKNNIQYHE
jgi:hypothetical protein